MPVEIRELQIIATVTDAQGNKTPAQATAGSVNEEEIIAKCVEQVMEILREKTER